MTSAVAIDGTIDVSFAALPGIAGQFRAAAASAHPGPLAAAVAQGIAGLGDLASAPALADLGRSLEQLMGSLELRAQQLATALDAAGVAYRAVDGAG